MVEFVMFMITAVLVIGSVFTVYIFVQAYKIDQEDDDG